MTGDVVAPAGVGEQILEPGPGRPPRLGPAGQERVQRRHGEHGVVENGGEVEYPVPDRDPDARADAFGCGEHAVGEVLDREGGLGGDLEPGIGRHCCLALPQPHARAWGPGRPAEPASESGVWAGRLSPASGPGV